MLEKNKLKALMEKYDLNLIGDSLPDPDVGDGIIVFVKAVSSSTTLNRKIKRAQDRLEKEGFSSKIVAVDQFDNRIEALLAASLRASFPDSEPRLTFASGPSGPMIWVNCSVETEEAVKESIKATIHRFLNQLEIEDAIIRFKIEKNYPSTTACLRVLRRYAPCSTDELAQKLQLPGFDQMDLKEVQRFLDTARRKGRVVRREDGRYILSLQCLMELGSSRDRFSPDISRALALRQLGS